MAWAKRWQPVITALLAATLTFTVTLVGSVADGKPAAKRVRVMVTGKGGMVAPATLLRTARVTVRAGKRSCTVAAGTPLAALVTASRKHRFKIRVKDFGNCSKRVAADSSQLFVNKVGSLANKKNDGWFYKVNDRAGTAGAADPSGPFGSGLLRSGDRVAWFYCKYRDRSASCQRSLRLIVGSKVSAGKLLRVKVIGYDNSKRGRAISKVRVNVGRQSAVTDKQGRAFFKPRSRGRYKLSASRRGMVPAFPRWVRVK